MVKVISVVMLAILVGGWGGCSTFQTSLVVSGESLKAVGKEFVEVAKLYKQGCDVDKVIKQPDCQSFKQFGLKFKQSYPISISVWETARAAGDVDTANSAARSITNLAAEMSKLAVHAYTVYGGGK